MSRHVCFSNELSSWFLFSLSPSPTPCFFPSPLAPCSTGDLQTFTDWRLLSGWQAEVEKINGVNLREYPKKCESKKILFFFFFSISNVDRVYTSSCINSIKFIFFLPKRQEMLAKQELLLYSGFIYKALEEKMSLLPKKHSSEMNKPLKYPSVLGLSLETFSVSLNINRAPDHHLCHHLCAAP